MAYTTSALLLYLLAKDYAAGSTSTTWADKSGNGRNATLTNFPTNPWNGSALVMDGVDDTVTIPGYIPLTADGVHSFEFVFETGSPGTVMDAVAWGGSGARYYITITGGSIVYGIAGTSFTVGSYTFTANTKYHFIFNRTSTGIDIWVNGTKVLTATYAVQSGSLSSSQPYLLGQHYVNSNRLNGKVYLNRFYSRNLTDTEITDNYNDAMSTAVNATVNAVAMTSSSLMKVPGIQLSQNVNAVAMGSTSQMNVPTAAINLNVVNATVQGVVMQSNSQMGIPQAVVNMWNDIVNVVLKGSLSESVKLKGSLNHDKELKGSINYQLTLKGGIVN